MNYIELFAGIGVGSHSIRKVFPGAKCKLFSENNKKAVETYRRNFYGHHLIEDVRDVKNIVGKVDLIIGGSPCQDLSIQKGKRQGLEGPKSKLFFEFARIIKETNPKHFILENVATMSQHDKNIITQTLGVEPVMLNSSWFGYQNRRRLYWCNFPITIPTEIDGLRMDGLSRWSSSGRGAGNPRDERTIEDGKANTLLRGIGCGGRSTRTLFKGEPLTAQLCETLAGLPQGWTSTVSEAERFKQIGNAFDAFTMIYILEQLRG